MSKRSCNICQGITRSGAACRRTTCKTGPFCFQHTKAVLGVQVKTSTIPHSGLGLFATKDFARGDYIDCFSGKQLTQAELDARYGDGLAPYTVLARYGRYYDQRHTNSGVTRYSNSCRRRNARQQACRNNCEIINPPTGRARALAGRLVGRCRYPVPWLRATRLIRAGEELFTDYGDDYFDDETDSDEE